MSRVGKKVIKLPEGVTLAVDGAKNHVVVKGPKGQLEFTYDAEMKIEIKENEVTIVRPSDSIAHRESHGTTRSLLFNMVSGVNEGFSKSLIIEGVGYRASLRDNILVVAAGYVKPVEMAIPEGLSVRVPQATEIIIEGIDKQKVGQFAAEVRQIRKPEPYKGKGIRYKTEIIRRKEGKKAT